MRGPRAELAHTKETLSDILSLFFFFLFTVVDEQTTNDNDLYWI
jgi:hypothetical protein